MVALAIQLPAVPLSEFCRKWKIRQLAVFGSVLRDDFRPDSDIDFLATFSAEARWSLLDLIVAEEELSLVVGRPVDLVQRSSIEQSENWLRRDAILSSAQVIYGG